MKLTLQILVLIATISVYAVVAVQEEDVGVETNDVEEYGDFFEGDMMLNTHQIGAILNVNQRNGLIAEKYRWPSNILFYEIDDVFDAIQVSAIEHALKTLQQHTCIHFEKRNRHTRDYVYVTGEPTGCHSRVGRQTGKQILNLKPGRIGKGCFRIGTIMHEFIHALGFYHQQSASDRDDYIRIIFENIENGHLHNFQKYSIDKITGFGVPYDYESVMHYSSLAFSKNGEDTIVPLDPTAEIGQRTHLSQGDIEKLNIMYNCNK